MKEITKEKKETLLPNLSFVKMRKKNKHNKKYKFIMQRNVSKIFHIYGNSFVLYFFFPPIDFNI